MSSLPGQTLAPGSNAPSQSTSKPNFQHWHRIDRGQYSNTRQDTNKRLSTIPASCQSEIPDRQRRVGSAQERTRNRLLDFSDVIVGLLVQSHIRFSTLPSHVNGRFDRTECRTSATGNHPHRHRRGQPHIVTVTAEPLPRLRRYRQRNRRSGRCLPHRLKELEKAVAALDNSEQHSVLAELMDQSAQGL